MISFEYLGCILTALYNEWMEVMGNLWKAPKKWARISRILVKEGEDARMPGNFSKSVVQVVFLFGSETWVLTPHMGQTLGGFQHRAAIG